jgi:hypothetical protein
MPIDRNEAESGDRKETVAVATELKCGSSLESKNILVISIQTSPRDICARIARCSNTKLR